MKNYKAWVKEQGRKFLDEVGEKFEADCGEHGGKSDDPDFTSWADAHDHFVRFAAAQAEAWSLSDVNFVNHHSPNRDQKAVSKDQAIDAFVRDLTRVARQIRKRG